MVNRSTKDPGVRRWVIVMPSGNSRGGAEEALLQLTTAQRLLAVDLSIVFLEDGDLVERIRAIGIETFVFVSRRLRYLIHYGITVWRLQKTLRRLRPALALGWMTKGHLYAGPAAYLAGVPAICFQHGLPGKGIVDRAAWLIPMRGFLACSRYVAGLQKRESRIPSIATYSPILRMRRVS